MIGFENITKRQNIPKAADIGKTILFAHTVGVIDKDTLTSLGE